MGLATVRRTVESMLGQVLGVQQLSSLQSCLLRLLATPAGHTELAAIADASPFAAWDATGHVFFYSYYHLFPHTGSTVCSIGTDSLDRSGRRPMPLRDMRCVHLEFTEGRLCARVAIPTTIGHPISFIAKRTDVVLIPGHEYDLLYERGHDATTPPYELVATRMLD